MDYFFLTWIEVKYCPLNQASWTAQAPSRFVIATII